VEVRRSPISNEHGETLLVNRCRGPIALLVVVCDLAVRPACRADPIASTGWSADRGVEYLAPAGAKSWPSAPGLQRGWRAQIAACRLARLPDAIGPTAVQHDPCARRLDALKSSLQASGGQSMRSIVRRQRAGCST
jgi:hypothetical protein